jgi:hypothetical protein
LSNTLDSSLTISRLELLVKTQEAALDGETIVGRFAKIPLAIYKPARLCEEFANSLATPSQILRFTKKYAPLMNSAKPDGAFRFELSEWTIRHQMFRDVWRVLARTLGKEDPQKFEKYWPFPQGSRMTFSRTGIVFHQDRFFDLINLCFAGLPWQRIRFCPAEDCETPFFIATHLKQAYCGDQACVEWGKRKLKLEYWNRNKERFLAERRRNRRQEQ